MSEHEDSIQPQNFENTNEERDNYQERYPRIIFNAVLEEVGGRGVLDAQDLQQNYDALRLIRMGTDRLLEDNPNNYKLFSYIVNTSRNIGSKLIRNTEGEDRPMELKNWEESTADKYVTQTIMVPARRVRSIARSEAKINTSALQTELQSKEDITSEDVYVQFKTVDDVAKIVRRTITGVHDVNQRLTSFTQAYELYRISEDPQEKAKHYQDLQHHHQLLEEIFEGLNQEASGNYPRDILSNIQIKQIIEEEQLSALGLQVEMEGFEKDFQLQISPYILRKLILNLGQNAERSYNVKFGKNTNMSERKFRISVQTDDGYPVIRVRDSGIGYPDKFVKIGQFTGESDWRNSLVKGHGQGMLGISEICLDEYGINIVPDNELDTDGKVEGACTYIIPPAIKETSVSS